MVDEGHFLSMILLFGYHTGRYYLKKGSENPTARLDAIVVLIWTGGKPGN